MTEQRPIARRTASIMAEFDLKAKKSLGQNFLTDTWVIDKIADAAKLEKKASGVIEIGPGLGALTEVLIEQAAQVVALEIDESMISILKILFNQKDNLKIIHTDALKTKFGELVEQHLSACSKIHLVANLPYYITSPLVTKMLQELPQCFNMVIMMQKEVAERILASPGSKLYGYLTVLVQYYAEAAKVVKVPNTLFKPTPEVDSMVISLIPHSAKIAVKDEEFFLRVVRASFAHRRKQLLNSLAANLNTGISKQELQSLLEELNIDPQRRGETLSLEEFAKLSDAVYARSFR